MVVPTLAVTVDDSAPRLLDVLLGSRRGRRLVLLDARHRRVVRLLRHLRHLLLLQLLRQLLMVVLCLLGLVLTLGRLLLVPVVLLLLLRNLLLGDQNLRLSSNPSRRRGRRGSRNRRRTRSGQCVHITPG